MNCIKNEHIKNEPIKKIMYKKWTYKKWNYKKWTYKNERIKNELIKKRTDPFCRSVEYFMNTSTFWKNYLKIVFSVLLLSNILNIAMVLFFSF